MDKEVTLRINENGLHADMDMAYRNGYIIQELTNFLFEKVISSGAIEIEDFPVSEWIKELNEVYRGRM